jgi:hypothetical protein
MAKICDVRKIKGWTRQLAGKRNLSLLGDYDIKTNRIKACELS